MNGKHLAACIAVMVGVVLALNAANVHVTNPFLLMLPCIVMLVAMTWVSSRRNNGGG